MDLLSFKGQRIRSDTTLNNAAYVYYVMQSNRAVHSEGATWLQENKRLVSCSTLLLIVVVVVVVLQHDVGSTY